ncbi:MAG TPA: NAD(P)H-binding protein [Chitinophaga sp.]|uniref:NAD(P)H-binding protein n=1 Tax=Chitinophaga sp. TaxID=1869181 RepID=UPI002B78AAA6|nr:NAD(P)H-binding protein [Chitinophaga sp.]HVI45276.1 NAD(P)H-binding protein [Chitinophaga sp.]
MDQNVTTISILACGWLGRPLAHHLANAGYQVKGARTTENGAKELCAAGIDGYAVTLTPETLEAPDAFWDADILIINIPPRSKDREPDAHVKEVTLLRDKLKTSRIGKVIFVSSTSVYADINDLVTEANMEKPETSNGQALREAEQLLLQSPEFKTTVLRFGGLIGYDRVPTAETLATGRRVNDVPMNSIHRDDCIGVIARVIEKDVWNEIFNACASAHPIRYHYYKAAAAALNLVMPKKLQPRELPYKIVSSSRLKKMLEYEFIYDDPLLIFKDHAGEK